ncbi:MAG: porin family protein [Flavobacteriaceae bacterium]|nr:porin family protein [Flavobacteriaceae bacterium]
MKTSIAKALCLALIFISFQGLHAQRENPRVESGKNLRTTILNILKNAKEEKVKPKTCDASKILKSIPRKKLVASKEVLAKEINRIMDTINLPQDLIMGKYGHIAFEVFSTSETLQEFGRGLLIKPYKDIPSNQQRMIKKYYEKAKRFYKKGIDLKPITVKHKGCEVIARTNIKPLKWKQGYNRSPHFLSIEWEITTEIDIECPCNEKNKHNVKRAIYHYRGKVAGPYSRYANDHFNIVGFGVRFGKVTSAKYKRHKLECCPEKPKTEDGSYVSPDEDINHRDIFVDTNVGVSVAKDEETEIVGAAGVFFYVTSLFNNPFYIGPKATVKTTSLTNSDIKSTQLLIGPSAEYRVPLANGNTQLLGGVNTGYSFGSVDAFGFKQNTSGIVANVYGGVEIQLNENIGVGVLLNLFEYSSIQFKPEEGEKTTVNNSLFITDRTTFSASLRIGLD